MKYLKYIVEGVDGAGKSTFIRKLQRRHPNIKFKIIHASSKTANTFEWFKKLFESNENVIFDRAQMGQFVYQNAEQRRKKGQLDFKQLAELEKIIKEQNIICYYVYNDLDTCLQNCRKDSLDSYMTYDYLEYIHNRFLTMIENSSVEWTKYYNNYQDGMDYKNKTVNNTIDPRKVDENGVIDKQLCFSDYNNLEELYSEQCKIEREEEKEDFDKFFDEFYNDINIQQPLRKNLINQVITKYNDKNYEIKQFDDNTIQINSVLGKHSKENDETLIQKGTKLYNEILQNIVNNPKEEFMTELLNEVLNEIYEESLSPEKAFDYDKLPKIIACDFDGTLVKNCFPKIIASDENINYDLVNQLKIEQKKGTKLILWTNRTGEALDDAVEFSNQVLGIVFDAVNDNVKEVKDMGLDPRKVWFSETWDDKAKQIKF